MARSRLTRTIDHLVLPTASLEGARARLGHLGFTVAPEGVHPFGTRNACVYLADGTFMEPLAVSDLAAADVAIGQGNVFVGRDRSYRSASGEEGFSALVLATGDAEADHRDFVGMGMSAGQRLDFSRPFVDAEGRADTASFRLAFAGTAATNDALFFTCERANVPQVDRSALQRHDNGVEALSGVVMVAERVEPHIDFFERLTGASANASQSGMVFDLHGSRLHLMTPDGFRSAFGLLPTGSGGLCLEAAMFRVSDASRLDTLAGRLTAAGIGAGRTAGALVVPKARGQGAVLVFCQP